MIQFKVFTFNPFQENCIVSYTKEKCIIFDPGCHDKHEFDELHSFIQSKNLTPVMLINTHCHLDHIFGNHFIFDEYGLSPMIHKDENYFLSNLDQLAAAYGLSAMPSPEAETFINEDTKLDLDDRPIDIFLTPGHSPGSLCFYFKKEKTLIGGDVLFRESIGRTDLPGGSFEQLESSIRDKLYPLPDDTSVIPGHGPSTRIGYEKRNNAFVKAL